MPDWFVFIEQITGFSVVLLSLCFLLLVNYALDWLPSKHFLVFLFALSIALKSSLFGLKLFNNGLSFGVFLVTYPFILLLGPVMSGFTRSTLQMRKQALMNRTSWTLLILGYLLVAPFLTLTLLPSIEQQVPSIQVIASGGMMAFVSLFVVTSSWYFIPVLWRVSRGGLYTVGYSENTYHWLRGIWLSMSLIWMMLLFDTVSSYFFNYESAWHDALFSFFDLLIWLALLFFTVVYCRKPRQEKEVEHCETNQKYERSALTNEQALEILQNVDNLMQEQRLFLESNITIDKLAALIKTQPQYLSQAINQYREVNFYEFIAGYRIEFAKQELRDSPSKSILDIAMSAGFNAKSTFNLTFKKMIGLTPSAYRKQQLT